MYKFLLLNVTTLFIVQLANNFYKIVHEENMNSFLFFASKEDVTQVVSFLGDTHEGKSFLVKREIKKKRKLI